MSEPIPFGKYLLLDRISVGGMAEVYKAKSFGVEGFEKIVAIKRILPAMAEDREFISMFIDEAKIAGQLNHANICQIFELGKQDDAHFIALEYVAGRDLLRVQNQYRRQKQLFPAAQAAYVAAKICEGLDYAHRKRDQLGRPMNIIHRDVSPQNVLISYDGEIKLIDFGIAKAASRSQSTQAGVLKGKFGYMSPEQVRGLPLDRRSDIFAIGTVLWEMLAGERLFFGESDFSTLERVRAAEVPSLASRGREVPAGLEDVVRRALARDVDDRWQWASEMQEALQGFLATQEPIYTAKSLAVFMKEAFAADLQREQAQMESYKRLSRSSLVTPLPPPPLTSTPRPSPSPPRTPAGGVPTKPASKSSPRIPVPPTPPPSGEPRPKGAISAPKLPAVQLPASGPGGRRPSSPRMPAVPPPPPPPLSARDPSDDVPTTVNGPSGFGTPAGVVIASQATLMLEPQPVAFAAEATHILGPDEPVHDQSTRILGPEGPANAALPNGGAGALAPPIVSPQLQPQAMPPLSYPGYPVQSSPGVSLSGARSGAVTGGGRRPGVGRDALLGIGVAALVVGLALGVRWGIMRHAGGGTGGLDITTDPPAAADIRIDGVSLGHLPAGGTLSIDDLSAGSHTLEVRAENMAAVSLDVDVAAGQRAAVHVPLPPPPDKGELNLDAPDDARLTLDGVTLPDGSAQRPILLTPGETHLVRVWRPHMAAVVLRVTLVGGQIDTRKVEITAPGAALAVRSQPPGAQLLIDDVPVGVTPIDLDSVDPARPHTVSLHLRGYAPITRRLAWTPPGQSRAVLDARLQPLGANGAPMPAPPPAIHDGYLLVNSEPAGAEVWIDDIDAGTRTPVGERNRIPVAPGQHVVSLEIAGVRRDLPVTIVSDKEENLVSMLR